MDESENPLSKLTHDDIARLPVAERVRLMDLIWETLVDKPEALPVSPEQLAEIRRRLEEHHEDPSTAIPWEEFLDQLQRDIR